MYLCCYDLLEYICILMYIPCHSGAESDSLKWEFSIVYKAFRDKRSRSRIETRAHESSWDPGHFSEGWLDQCTENCVIVGILHCDGLAKLANLIWTAKSGSDWTGNELLAFNIRVTNANTETIFNATQFPPAHVSDTILDNTEEARRTFTKRRPTISSGI